MNFAIGQTYKSETHAVVIEIVAITKAGRIKFDQYMNGECTRRGAVWTAKEVAKFFPTFVAN